MASGRWIFRVTDGASPASGIGHCFSRWPEGAAESRGPTPNRFYSPLSGPLRWHRRKLTRIGRASRIGSCVNREGLSRWRRGPFVRFRLRRQHCATARELQGLMCLGAVHSYDVRPHGLSVACESVEGPRRQLANDVPRLPVHFPFCRQFSSGPVGYFRRMTHGSGGSQRGGDTRGSKPHRPVTEAVLHKGCLYETMILKIARLKTKGFPPPENETSNETALCDLRQGFNR